MSAYSDIISDGGMDPRNKQDATARWAVFCAGCRKEWSVPYQHPGKSVCNKCETTLRQALEQPQDEWLTGCPECGMDGECGCDKQPAQHDYRTKYDRPCYKCRSNFCPGNCKEKEKNT